MKAKWRLALGVILSGLAFSPAVSQTSSSKDAWVGVWQTTPIVDQKAAFKDVVHPFHRKLVTYAVQQVEKSLAVLDLRPNHVAAYVFHDGFAADTVRLRGTWQMSGGNLRIDFDPPMGSTATVITHILIPSGDSLAWDTIPGLPKFFSGTLAKSHFVGVRDPGNFGTHGDAGVPISA